MCNLIDAIIFFHGVAYIAFGAYGVSITTNYINFTDFVLVATVFFFFFGFIAMISAWCFSSGVDFESTHYANIAYQLAIIGLLIWCFVVKLNATSEMKQKTDFMNFMSATLAFLFLSVVVNLMAFESVVRAAYGRYCDRKQPLASLNIV